jgi:DNA-directed RNA polymerase specialized sigma24 family protein
MSAAPSKSESPRALLCQAIVEVIQSWPEQPRLIFTQVHYGGRSIEEVAADFQLPTGTIRQILESYERKLRTALQPFRSGSEVRVSEPCLCYAMPPC